MATATHIKQPCQHYVQTTATSEAATYLLVFLGITGTALRGVLLLPLPILVQKQDLRRDWEAKYNDQRTPRGLGEKIQLELC